MPYYSGKARFCVIALALFWADPSWAVDDNPFTNEGGEGHAVIPSTQSTPIPKSPADGAAPRESEPRESGLRESELRESGLRDPTSLPRPDAKPDILVRMSRDTCQRVLRHRDVAEAGFVPDVDVRGDSVKSAEHAGTLGAADVLPEEIAFELALNPLIFAGNPRLASVFSNTSATIGSIKYDLLSGALTFNDIRIDATVEDDLILLCRQALARQ